MIELLTVLGICTVAFGFVGVLFLLMRWGRRLAADGPEKLKPTDRVTLVRSGSRASGIWVRFQNVSDHVLDRFVFRVRAMQDGAVAEEIREVVFLPTPPGREREVILSLVDCSSGQTLQVGKGTVSVEALGGYEPLWMAPRATDVGGIRRFFMGIASRSAGLSVRFAWETDPGRRMRWCRFSFYTNLVMALLWAWASLSWGDPGSSIMAPALTLLTLISGVQFWWARRKMRAMLR